MICKICNNEIGKIEYHGLIICSQCFQEITSPESAGEPINTKIKIPKTRKIKNENN